MPNNFTLTEGENGSLFAEIDFKWNTTKLKNIERRFELGFLNLTDDLINKAKGRAPVVTGALRNSIRREPINGLDSDGTARVIAGGTSEPVTINNRAVVRKVDYAAKREIGPNRNPATEHYMENTLKEVISDGWQQKYFGEITK